MSFLGCSTLFDGGPLLWMEGVCNRVRSEFIGGTML